MTDQLFDLDDPTEMLRTAYLSDDGLYRWVLTRVWRNPARLLTFVMLNPSTADALVDDPTIRRCIGYARELDLDGVRVVNLYAFRATNPADLWTAPDPVGPKNNTALRDALTAAAHHATPVIAAWGTHARPDRVAWLLDQPGAHRLSALHVTKAGAPGHPLYLSASLRPRPWPAP